jgi:alpha-mannosidase
VPLTYQERRLERLLRRLEELRSWRNAREVPIEEWTFVAGDGEPRQLKLGDFWPVIETPVNLTATTEFPSEFAGSPVELELSLGGEGLVRLSTGYQAGLNPMHQRFHVSDKATGGDPLTVDVEIVPKGIMGSDIPEPRLHRAMLVVPHREIRALERDLTMIHAAALELFNHEVTPLLLDAAEAALSELADGWPSSSDVVISRYVLGYDDGVGQGVFAEEDDWLPDAKEVSRPTRPIWSLPDPPRPLEPMSDEGLAAVERARSVLAGALETIKSDYPPVGRLVLTGHAHIDLAWLWPVAETRRKIRRTFSTILELMDQYPDFTFNQSSAQAYSWIEQDDPRVFERIRERVAEGRWEPSGGMWVESDCNITGGEAFARQLIYGQRYFQKTFGRQNRAAWLPDVFGFSAGIPQLLRGAGLTGFFTIKINWNEANTFPFDLFEWEGIDGSRVTAHTFFNPGHGYNGNIQPLDTLGTWRNFRGKRLHNEGLLSFGWGDGAGGPTERMLQNYERIRDFPALPRLRMGSIEEFYASLPREGLPRWVGELYLEFHRGTLTSQARVKELNRKSEHRLLEAEAFAAIASLDGSNYPAEQLETAWKTLLLNQFHDILPGSSINEVYQDTHRMLGEVVATATRLRDDALGSLTGSGNAGHFTISNAGLHPRRLQLELPGLSDAHSILDRHGIALPTQATDGGLLVASAGHTVPGLGWIGVATGNASDSPPTPAADPVTATPHADVSVTLQNNQIQVEIGSDGTITRLFDKQAHREALADRGNQIWAFVDKPYTYDAWDVDEDYERDGEEIRAVDPIDVIESGPLRGSVRITRTFRSSKLTQTYRLWTDSRRLDIETDIDWHERQILLKARFPLAVRSHEATYETMYGVIRRPTHRNTPWDAAKFEVSGHRFADMSELDYGVALLNDAKYGHESRDNVLMLSLLRGPLYPDPLADLGRHHFIYSLFPHAGDWTEAGVTEEAFTLNSPLIVCESAQPVHEHSLLRQEGLSLALGSLKRAEDGNGLVLRVYEPHGARGVASLRFDRVVTDVERVNLLEEPASEGAAPMLVSPNTVLLDVRPFEVISLHLKV